MEKKLIKFYETISNRFQILEYSVVVAETKIEYLEKLLINDSNRIIYVQETREKLKAHLESLQTPLSLSLLDSLDDSDDF